MRDLLLLNKFLFLCKHKLIRSFLTTYSAQFYSFHRLKSQINFVARAKTLYVFAFNPRMHEEKKVTRRHQGGSIGPSPLFSKVFN